MNPCVCFRSVPRYLEHRGIRVRVRIKSHLVRTFPRPQLYCERLPTNDQLAGTSRISFLFLFQAVPTTLPKLKHLYPIFRASNVYSESIDCKNNERSSSLVIGAEIQTSGWVIDIALRGVSTSFSKFPSVFMGYHYSWAAVWVTWIFSYIKPSSPSVIIQDHTQQPNQTNPVNISRKGSVQC